MLFVAFLALSLAFMCVFIKKITHIVITFLILISVLFSVLNVDNKISNSVKFSNEKYIIDCTVISDETTGENAKCVTVKTNSNNYELSNTKYYLYYRNNSFKCGQKLKLSVHFFKFDKTNRGYLVSKGIYGSLWLTDVRSVNGYNVFYKLIGSIRNFIKSFMQSDLSKESAGVVTSIMLGDKSMLKDSFYENVKRSGVSHIMAVSGLHLSVILGFLHLVLLRFVRNKYMRFFLNTAAVFLIAGICGFTPSVLRAGLMFLIIAFAPLIGKDTDVLSVISLAVLIILLFSPMLLFNVSFEMSVLAIISVIYVAPFYYNLMFKNVKGKRFLKVFVSAILVSLLANIFTMPVAIYYFETVSLVSVITNIFISLPTTLIIEFSMGGMILFSIPFLSKIVMKAADVLTLYIVFVINYFGNFKYSAITVSKEYCVVPVVFIAVIIAVKLIVERRTSLHEYS